MKLTTVKLNTLSGKIPTILATDLVLQEAISQTTGANKINLVYNLNLLTKNILVFRGDFVADEMGVIGC